MGASSSAEPPAPQDGDGTGTAAAGPPRTPPEPLPAEEAPAPQPLAEHAKVLDASLPVPDVNEDSLEPDAPPQESQQLGTVTGPQELDGQQPEVASPLQEPPREQAEAAGTNVGQTEHSSVTVKEDTETMETSPSDSNTRDSADAEKEDAQTVKQLTSLEEDTEDLDHASEPQSYDLGFKKVFKFVGFRFTVKKEKTGKSEPVQLLTVKKETQVPEGTDDQKEVGSEEIAMPEDALPAEDNTKDALKNEKTEDESPKTPEANETCSQSAALATDTASPLRKFFTQGWTGFRKKKSFRKPKEDELQSPTKEEEQEKEGATLTTETSEKEEKSGFEKQDEEKNVTVVTIEAHEEEQTEGEKQESKKTVAAMGAEACEKEELIKHDEQGQKEDVAAAAVVKENAKEKKAEEDDQERKLVEVSDLGKKEEKTEEGEKESEVTDKPLKTRSMVPVTTDSVNGELKTSSEVLPMGEEPESTRVKYEIEDRTEIASEEKPEAGSLAVETSSEKIKKTEGREGNKPAPLGKETFDEKTEEKELKISPTSEDITGKLDTQGEAQDRTTERKESKEHETKLSPSAPGFKSFSTSERSVDTTENDQQSVKPTEEGLQGKTDVVMTDTLKPDEITAEITPEEAAGKRPPEGITNEAELLSSQEKTKLQGSPLKKLFTGTGLKKLSGKKHKGKREESKLGEQGELIQHLSDSPDSPEEQKGESSASSPEEMNEIPSLEKPVDGMQVTENEDAAVSDVERKRESVTPWASFKKMVTPKKRVRRPSESDKEEETDKTKSAAVSATENAVDENQGELKENGMDQKQEKATEEPKRKVDTSVSWEAFICVGSSKKRARKSSSSDEETEHKLGQESQKVEESGQSKETATDAILTSSQESDQGQGNSSPEQAGSPSEGEGISTWESFKRLVTPRRKSKTRMEERTEDSVVGSSLEHSTSDGEPGKDESWVPFRKLMPGRRKKKSDGKPEPTHLTQAREDMAETTEEDSDIPAVVPLSEYEAAEQEKVEAQQVKDTEAMREPTSEEERAEKLEEPEGLVHAVTVTVVEGERAVTSIEERSPSWISAALTECVEQAKEEEEKETEKTCASDVTVEEAVVAAKTAPETRKDISDDTTASEVELTSEAVTALEETAEASCAEEAMEVSLAEETTEMVSAVSQLLETPDTTEEVTPVQEVEATEQNLKELDKQTQKVLHEVAERVKSADVAQLVSERTMTATVMTTVQGIESKVEGDAKDEKVTGQETVLLEQSLKKEEHKEDDLQALESAGSIQDQTGAEESVLQEGSETSEISAATKESTEGYKNVDVLRDESQWQACEEPVVDDHEEITEVQRTVEEPSSQDRDFHIIKAATPKKEPFTKQEPSEQEKLPITDLRVDERRDERTPEVQTAVQDKTEDETSTLGLPDEEPVQLEGEDKILTVGQECTEAAVTVVTIKPERQDEIPDLDSQEQAYTEGVPSRASAQRGEDRDDAVILGVQSTEVTVTEVPPQIEVKTSAPPSETIGSEAAADAEQSVRDEAVRQITEKDSVPILEPQCREETTETPSQSDETEGGQMEEAVLETEAHLESDTTITEAPAQTEAESVSDLASASPDITENGSTFLTDISPKKCETLSSLVEEETVEKEQLIETSSRQDFQKEDNKNEQLIERVKEVFESGKQEVVRGDECSTAVQQEVLTVQEEGSDSAFLQAESLEALKAPVPVATAAAEEHVVAEAITPADMTAETVQPLATTPDQMASEEVPVTTVDYSGCGTAELGSAGAPEPQVTPASMNGISEEQERPQSTGQPEQNGIPPSDSLSLTHTEFEKDIVPTVTIETQSTKIVLNAIQTAVHKLEETEASAAFESDEHIKSTGKSSSDTNTPEFLESTQVDHQPPVKEEEIRSTEQKLQQPGTVKTATLTESAEIHATLEKTKDILLISKMLKDGQSPNSLTIVTSPEDIPREGVRLQKSALELSTSEESTKDPLGIHAPKLKEKEVGRIMEIPDQHTGQQTCRESEEQHQPPVEDGKTETWEDGSYLEGTSCDSPQSQNSVAPEALNMC